MGSGKTTAMLNMIKDNPDTRYLFVTPYREEFKRIKAIDGREFKTPYVAGQKYKIDTLHDYLEKGSDIVTTHALFSRTTEETIRLIQDKQYTLILDEALDIIQEYNDIVKASPEKTLNKSDVKWVLKEGLLYSDAEDLSTHWDASIIPDFKYSELVQLSDKQNLYCVDYDLIWLFPAKIFSVFKEVFILTYRFEGTFFDRYLQMNNLPYTKLSSRKEGDSYTLCPYEDDLAIRKEFAKLIHIYEGPLNDIGNAKNAFSVTWLANLKADRLKQLQNNMRNYTYDVSKSIGPVTSQQIMWTTTKRNDFYKKLERVRGFKYANRANIKNRSAEGKINPDLCFVPCNAKATNAFQDRNVLLYMLNRYSKPELLKYFSALGFPVDEDVYALNELIQWIWRSAIRKEHEIYLYIPSQKMRELLLDWLGQENALDEPRPKRFKKAA